MGIQVVRASARCQVQFRFYYNTVLLFTKCLYEIFTTPFQEKTRVVPWSLERYLMVTKALSCNTIPTADWWNISSSRAYRFGKWFSPLSMSSMGKCSSSELSSENLCGYFLKAEYKSSIMATCRCELLTMSNNRFTSGWPVMVESTWITDPTFGRNRWILLPSFICLSQDCSGHRWSLDSNLLALHNHGSWTCRKSSVEYEMNAE